MNNCSFDSGNYFKGIIEYYFAGTTDSYLVYQEESPICCKTVFHLTNGRSNTRESATEIRLPLQSGKGEKVV